VGSEVLVNRRTTTHCEVQQVMVLGESGRVMIGICGGFIQEISGTSRSVSSTASVTNIATIKTSHTKKFLPSFIGSSPEDS